jgi:PAS domain S-box-containing protein
MFRKRADEELLEAGALQKAIFNSVNFSSIATDAKGVVKIFNVGAERMLGYAAVDVVNKITPADISDPQEVIARAAALSKELATPIAPGFEALVYKASRGIEDIYELTYVRKDGSRFPAVVSVTALRDADGSIIGYLLIGTDNTARKRAEEALLKTGALQRAIFNSANFSSIATDANGVIQIFNVGAERMLGYAAADVVNKITPADISDPEEVIARAHTLSSELATSIAPGFEALVFKASRGIEDIYELTYIRKDGSRFPAIVSVTALRDAEGTIIGYLLIGTDNTARKRATEQFRLALEAAPTGMLMTNEAGEITLVNAQIEALFGYPREELLGQPLEMLVPERSRAHHPHNRKLFFGEPKARIMGAGRELYGLRKGGTEVPVEISLNPLQTAEGYFVLSSIADITDRKRAQETLHALNAELEQRVIARTSELRERESLLQEIHHRVKNNLQVISSLINMQIRGLEDESSRVALRDCQSRVVTMAQIHEMLYQSTDYARVPFAKYARDLTARVLSASGISPGTVALHFELEELSLPVEQAIPCGLILNELVANSLKHAFPNVANGTICVELRLAPDNSVLLSVSDNGIGLSPELDLENLSSLGVHLVMTLVEQLEGNLEIVRLPGSTFRITFPLESRA